MPNVDEKNYNIGRGKVLFKPSGETNFRDLGNAPDFKFAVKTTVLKHPSSREGMKTFDDQVTTEQTAAGSLTLDDLKDFNMKNFIMAAAVNAANQADGTVTLGEKKMVLASILGTIPETLSRAFAKLSKLGVISIDGQTIIVHDRRRLADIAAGEKI